MAKLTLATLTSAYQAVPALNANNDLIEAAFENTLSRDGTTPNTMGAALDMNSNRILNLAEAIGGSDAVNLTQINALLASAAGATLTGPIAATLISIADGGGFYTAVDVEGALQEIFTLLASLANGSGASLIGVEDAAANFTGTDLEAVLAELAAVSVASATTTAEGIIELATQTEVNTGTDAVRAVTPSTYAGRKASDSRDGIIELATQSEVDTGVDAVRAVTPATLSSFSGLASSGAGARGALAFDIQQLISNNILTTLILDSESYDTDNIHDLSVNKSRLTVPAGVTRIRLSGSAIWANNLTGYRHIMFTKNGSTTGPVDEDRGTYIPQAVCVPGGGTAGSVEEHGVYLATGAIKVSPGDFFEMRVRQGSGIALLVIDMWFEMEILE